MTATQDIAMKSAKYPSPFLGTLATTAAQIEQRAKNRHSFQAKYDAMLYIVEFIASFSLFDIRNSKQAKKMEDLKSLVNQTRNRLGICQTEKH